MALEHVEKEGKKEGQAAKFLENRGKKMDSAGPVVALEGHSKAIHF